MQETYFWREIDQIEALVKSVVPKLATNRESQPLRIWSAGCATGEEPLTIAMALNEAGWFAKAAIEIVATDASQRALDKAARNRYGDRSFRSLPSKLKDKYFSQTADGWRIAPEIYDRVRWSRVNMLSTIETAPFADSPVVVCRNMFIYFSLPTIERIAQDLGGKMPSPSYLLLGAAESLMALSTRFELERAGGAFWYVKR